MLGRRTSYVYDLTDRLIAEVTPLNTRLTTIFNSVGNTLATINPLGYRTSYGYDPLGRQVRIHDAENRLATTVFDKNNREIASLGFDGSRTSQLFDGAGQWIALIDSNANRTSFVYDAAGQRTLVLDALGRRTTIGYDAAGRSHLRVDARGFRTTYSYDATSRLTGRAYPTGDLVTLAYDALDRRIATCDAIGRTSTAYDAVGQKHLVSMPNGQRLTYAFDAIGRRSALVDPAEGRYTYNYNAAGQITLLINPANERTTWSYDAGDRVVLQDLANGALVSVSYDLANNVRHIQHLASGSVLAGYAYALDRTGMRKSVLEAGGARATWTYDGATRLIREERSGATSYCITHAYDEVGNQLLRIDGGGRATYAYDKANQLRRADELNGRTTFSYDPCGNQIVEATPSGSRTTQTWGTENDVRVVQLPTGVRHSLIYDPLGRVVQMEDVNGSVNLLWDEQNLLWETGDGEQVLAQYTVDPRKYGLLISHRSGGTSGWYHFDARGTTTRVTNSAMSVIAEYVWDAYGRVFLSQGSNGHYLYGGQVGYYFVPAISQYNVRARWYRPDLGRFSSRDPLIVLSGRQQVLRFSHYIPVNLYQYVRANPINAIDPSGLFDIRDIAIYGNYCGPRNGPGVPVDCVDRACQRHDACLATPLDWLTSWARCDNILCSDVNTCVLTCQCVSASCLAGASAILAYSCVCANVLTAGGSLAPPAMCRTVLHMLPR